jgi:hypothetical protein
MKIEIKLKFNGRCIPTLGNTSQEIFVGRSNDSKGLTIDLNTDFEHPLAAYSLRSTQGVIRAYWEDIMGIRGAGSYILDGQTIVDGLGFGIQAIEERVFDWIKEIAARNTDKYLGGFVKITDKNSVIKAKFNRSSYELPDYLKVWKFESIESTGLSTDDLFSGFNTESIKSSAAICSIDLMFPGDTIPATGKVNKYKAYTGGFHYYEEELNLHPRNDEFEHIFCYSKPDGFWSSLKEMSKGMNGLSGCYEVKNFVMSNKQEQVSQWLTNIVKHNPILSGYVLLEDKIQSIKVEFDPKSNKYKIWKGQAIKTFDASGNLMH